MAMAPSVQYADGAASVQQLPDKQDSKLRKNNVRFESEDIEIYGWRLMGSSSWFSPLIMALLIIVIKVHYQKAITFHLCLLAFRSEKQSNLTIRQIPLCQVQLLVSMDRCRYSLDLSPKIIQSSSKILLMVVPRKSQLMDTLACEDSCSIWTRICGSRPSGGLVPSHLGLCKLSQDSASNLETDWMNEYDSIKS